MSKQKIEYIFRMENLELNKPYTYKKLCEVLEVKYQRGNSKPSQLRELKTLCKVDLFEKGKYVISEIYASPIPKIDSRGEHQKFRNSNTADYIAPIEKLLLDFLAEATENSNGEVIQSTNQMFIKLNMVNRNYQTGKYRTGKLATKIGVHKPIIDDYYNSVDGMLVRNLEKALNELSEKRLITWHKVIMYIKWETQAQHFGTPNYIKCEVKKDKYGEDIKVYKLKESLYPFYYVADDEMEIYITKTERSVLNEMGYNTKDHNKIGHVRRDGKIEEFYEKVDKILLEKKQISRYYRSYKVLFDREFILEEIDNTNEYLLNIEEKQEQQKLLNDGIKNRVTIRAKSRKAKAEAKPSVKQFHRLRSDFIAGIDVINGVVIDVEAEDIREKIKKSRVA